MPYGIVSVLIAVPESIPSEMLVILLLNEILARDVSPENAPLPTAVTELGMERLDRLLIEANAEAPMLVNEVGRFTLVNFRPKKL